MLQAAVTDHVVRVSAAKGRTTVSSLSQKILLFIAFDLLCLPGIYLFNSQNIGYRIGQILACLFFPIALIGIQGKVPWFWRFRCAYVFFFVGVAAYRYNHFVLDWPEMVYCAALAFAYFRPLCYFTTGAYLAKITRHKELLVPGLLRVLIVSLCFIVFVAGAQIFDVAVITDTVNQLYVRNRITGLEYFSARPSSVFDGSVVVFAQFLTVMLFVGICSLKGSVLRPVVLIMAGGMLVFNQTRSVLAPVVPLVGVLLFLNDRIPVRVAYLIGVCVTGILLVSDGGILAEGERIPLVAEFVQAGSASNVRELRSLEGRISDTWPEHLIVWKAYPFFGRGAAPVASDSQYLPTLARTGTFGFVLFILEMASLFAFVRSCRTDASPRGTLAQALFWSYFAFLVTGFFFPVYDGGRVVELVWLLLGVLSGMNNGISRYVPRFSRYSRTQ